MSGNARADNNKARAMGVCVCVWERLSFTYEHGYEWVRAVINGRMRISTIRMKWFDVRIASSSSTVFSSKQITTIARSVRVCECVVCMRQGTTHEQQQYVLIICEQFWDLLPQYTCMIWVMSIHSDIGFLVQRVECCTHFLFMTHTS